MDWVYISPRCLSSRFVCPSANPVAPRRVPARPQYPLATVLDVVDSHWFRITVTYGDRRGGKSPYLVQPSTGGFSIPRAAYLAI